MKEKIIQAVKDFVLNSPDNWFKETNNRFFDEPLVGFASAEDALFQQYKTVVGSEHLTPKEAFETQFGTASFKSGTVISIALPLNEKIRESNRAQKDRPSRLWVLNRSFGDGLFIPKAACYAENLLKEFGYNAVSPYVSSWFKTIKKENGPISIWSERHIAYSAGLGTFSLNDAFITRKGIAVRFVSVVTDLILEPDVRNAASYNANCLFFGAPAKCGQCIKRCPVGAISEKGHDKNRCFQFVYSDESKKLVAEYGGIEKYGGGCGLCQTAVPCEYANPYSSL